MRYDFKRRGGERKQDDPESAPQNQDRAFAARVKAELQPLAN